MSDAVFDTPLQGCSLVEASAGTGKTFALAGLFVRAVIERRLAPAQILAVTFTTAATQELRARVRLRLQQAAQLAAQWQAGDAATREGDDAGNAMLRRMLHAAVADGESTGALRLRLARAARELDLATISTIHGFCQRVLAEHALDAGQALGESGIEERRAQARHQLAVALWREHAQDAAGASFLLRFFRDLKGLRKSLDDLLSHEPLLPEAHGGDAGASLQSAWSTLHHAFVAHGANVRAALEQATAAKVLSRDKKKAPDLDALWTWFEEQGDAVPAVLPEHLPRISNDGLLDLCLKNKEAQRPTSPLFDAIDSLLIAFEAHDLQRLHALRAAAQRRDAERKAALQLRDFDDLIGALHAAVTHEATRAPLAAALRAQYRLALIDEFQDTDARQWAIFRALFADAAHGDGGLVLVGDPKQAIYRFRGGDVHAYVEARETVQRDDIRLEHNFRSRPALLAATNALFQRMPDDALGAGIGWAPVQPGGKAHDDDLLLDGRPAPPLAFHVVPPGDDGKDWTKDPSIEHAAALCADAIRERLQQAHDGRLLRRDGDRMRPLEPRDCAVLARTHEEATAVRDALARCNVPAATVDRTSLYASDEARELRLLLLALLHAGDDERLRAALATPLFALDAADIAALQDGSEALRTRQLDFDAWRTRWQRHGPQAMLADVVAGHATRMLEILGGERRIANLLQLGELLQEASLRSLGVQGQVDWLEAAIANPDNEDEAQLPRLESDADRVQVMTLHKSKGLEFPLVFLPFAAIGRDANRSHTKTAVYQHGGRRVRQVRTAHAHAGAPSWSEARAGHDDENRAEDMRILYVGLTRAREGLWLCGGALASNRATALHALLAGNAPSPALRKALGDVLVVSEGTPPHPPLRLASRASAPLPAEREPQRTLRRDWWLHSFSQLHRQAPQGLHALEDETPADDERGDESPLAVADRSAHDPRFVGPRFGNVLHHALEHADFSAWRDRGELPESQREILLQAFAAFGYRDEDAQAGMPLLASLLARTLNARVPAAEGTPGFRLCELDPRARIDEMEFHFALRGGDVSALLALLHAHGVLRGRRGFGAWHTLAGLMTGKIDLTCRVDGRFYVLDYKTNVLPAWDAPAIGQAMAEREYDWQALLYLVALQRWLRLKLGREYDFARHVGGVRYLFCRGLDASRPGRGVHVLPFTRELVDAVDAALATPLPEIAP